MENNLILSSTTFNNQQKLNNRKTDVKLSKNIKAKERKAKRVNLHKKKGSGTTKRNKRRHDIEITTCAVDVLESKSDLIDRGYLLLKDKVLSKLPNPETLIQINHSQTLEDRIYYFIRQ